MGIQIWMKPKQIILFFTSVLFSLRTITCVRSTDFRQLSSSVISVSQYNCAALFRESQHNRCPNFTFRSVVTPSETFLNLGKGRKSDGAKSALNPRRWKSSACLGVEVQTVSRWKTGCFIRGWTVRSRALSLPGVSQLRSELRSVPAGMTHECHTPPTSPKSARTAVRKVEE